MAEDYDKDIDETSDNTVKSTTEEKETIQNEKIEDKNDPSDEVSSNP